MRKVKTVFVSAGVKVEVIRTLFGQKVIITSLNPGPIDLKDIKNV